jgi:peptide-methionine (S)-S-oxide reductase
MKSVRVFSFIVLAGLLAVGSAALAKAKPKKEAHVSPQTATFAMGCFWQPDEFFRKVPGVLETEVGYTGGRVQNPNYKQVCYTDTGHAEAINIKFDPSKISYRKLLELFWNNHDPTTLNRQGPDRGEQYRSAIFTHGPGQDKEARETLKIVAEQKIWGDDPIVTQIVEAKEWWPAEEYHQKYLEKAGVTECHLPTPPKKMLKL